MDDPVEIDTAENDPAEIGVRELLGLSLDPEPDTDETDDHAGVYDADQADDADELLARRAQRMLARWSPSLLRVIMLTAAEMLAERWEVAADRIIADGFPLPQRRRDLVRDALLLGWRVAAREGDWAQADKLCLAGYRLCWDLADEGLHGEALTGQGVFDVVTGVCGHPANHTRTIELYSRALQALVPHTAARVGPEADNVVSEWWSRVTQRLLIRGPGTAMIIPTAPEVVPPFQDDSRHAKRVRAWLRLPEVERAAAETKHREQRAAQFETPLLLARTRQVSSRR